MISVVLSTYNGEKYIKEQMISLMNQTVKADEIIIIDDKSTDSTVKIVNDFILSNLLNWILKINIKNVGWKRNFYDGLCLSKGDIIFLCDQDDIWDLKKIEYMSKAFIDNDKINVLQSNYHILYCEDCSKINFKNRFRIILDNISHKRSHNSFKIKIRKIKRNFLHQEPGCVMAVRNSFFKSIQNIWDYKLGHDFQFTVYAEFSNSYYTIDYNGIIWRRHFNNASTPIHFDENKRKNELLENGKMLLYISNYIQTKNAFIENKTERIIERSIQLNEIRKKYVIEMKMFYWFLYIFYFSYFDRKRDLFTDIIYHRRMCKKCLGKLKDDLI